MPRGTSRIFREKVSSAASALGISGGIDFRRAGDVFIERARDAYADLGFSVGAAGRSSKEFRELVELANAELGIVSFATQEFSIEYDGGNGGSRMQGPSSLLGIANTWTWLGWFASEDVTDAGGTLFNISGGNANRFFVVQRGVAAGGTFDTSIQFFSFDSGAVNIQNVHWRLLAGMQDDLWYQVVITWDGTAANRKLYWNGVDQGPPDVTTVNLDGTMTDTARVLQFGGGVSPNLDGRGAAVALYDKILGSAEVLETYADGQIDFNLGADSGNYASAANLQHWWETGKTVSPFLGLDTGVSGALIDMEAAAFNINDGDRRHDVPGFSGVQTQSLDFDGLQDRLGHGPRLLGVDNSWSFGAWLKPRGTPNDPEYIWRSTRPGAPTDGSRMIFSRAGVGGPTDLNRLNVVLTNVADTVTINAFWNDFFVADEWVFLLITWDGTTAAVWKNGVDLGAPDTGNNSPGGLTLADDATRNYTLGNGFAPSNFNAWNGLMAQAMWWRDTVDTLSEPLSLYNTGNPNGLNLNRDFLGVGGPPGYISASDLAHWWRTGHDPLDLSFDSAERVGGNFTPTMRILGLGVGPPTVVTEVPS